MTLPSRVNSSGPGTIGSLMLVDPPSSGQLSFTEVAGRRLGAGDPDTIDINLPAGTLQAQDITVRGEGFEGILSVRVALIPQTGEPSYHDIELDFSDGNVATTTVQVEFPIANPTRVMAWTR